MNKPATCVLGIDPGSTSGAYAFINFSGEVSHVGVFRKTTPHDFAQIVRDFDPAYAWIEKVGAMPKQGIASTFKFGTSFGGPLWALAALAVPYDVVLPRVWMRAVGGIYGSGKTRSERKRALKARAQQLFPTVKWTLTTADAGLIAEACRQHMLATTTV